MELRTLWGDDTAEVILSRWDRARHLANRDGCTRFAVIEFMRTGSYCRRLPHGDVLIDPNLVAFFNPLESFQVSHPCGDCNSGVSLRFSSDFLANVRTEFECEAFAAGPRPFRTTAAISSPRCHLLQARLVDMLSHSRSVDLICVEELLLGLIREALTAAHHVNHPRDCFSSGRAVRRDLDRVETIRRYLLIHWAERLTLGTLAEQVDCSHWHLAERFRARMGLPIYRYLKHLRLRHALARLSDGCSDLTRLALDCGFSSHSHLSMAFRQEFGTTPRSVRSALTRHK